MSGFDVEWFVDDLSKLGYSIEAFPMLKFSQKIIRCVSAFTSVKYAPVLTQALSTLSVELMRDRLDSETFSNLLNYLVAGSLAYRSNYPHNAITYAASTLCQSVPDYLGASLVTFIEDHIQKKILSFESGYEYRYF